MPIDGDDAAAVDADGVALLRRASADAEARGRFALPQPPILPKPEADAASGHVGPDGGAPAGDAAELFVVREPAEAQAPVRIEASLPRVGAAAAEVSLNVRVARQKRHYRRAARIEEDDRIRRNGRLPDDRLAPGTSQYERSHQRVTFR